MNSPKYSYLKNWITLLASLLGFALHVSGQSSNMVMKGVNLKVMADTHLKNTGSMRFEDDTFVENEGVISVAGDWSNNTNATIFNTARAGTVSLYGLDQYIGGASPTRFDTLLLNTEPAVVSLDNSLEITGYLDLANSIVDTRSSRLHISNTSPDALQWETGFVESSDVDGCLMRSTMDTATYMFPIGSDRLYQNYRAIMLQPESSDSAVFNARLGAGDVTFQSIQNVNGRLSTNPSGTTTAIGSLSQDFYHIVGQDHGTGGGFLRMYFFRQDAPVEGFNTLAKWNADDMEWEDTFFKIERAPATEKIGDPNMMISGYVDEFNTNIYTLASESHDHLFSQIITPDGDGFNDTFIINGLENYPGTTVQILNRWGNKVFESREYSNDWDGSFNGAVLPEGTYFYQVALGGTDLFRGFVEIISN